MSKRRARGRKSLIRVHGIPQLEAAVLAMKAADKDIKRDINARARAVMGPVWVQTLAEQIQRPGDRIILAGARIAAGNPPTLVAGNSKRKIGRGLIPVENWAGYEYGAVREYKTSYQRVSKNGKRHQVKRSVVSHLPKRREIGRIITPTVRKTLPRLASLWVQTIVKTYMDAFEGKE